GYDQSRKATAGRRRNARVDGTLQPAAATVHESRTREVGGGAVVGRDCRPGMADRRGGQPGGAAKRRRPVDKVFCRLATIGNRPGEEGRNKRLCSHQPGVSQSNPKVQRMPRRPRRRSRAPIGAVVDVVATWFAGRRLPEANARYENKPNFTKTKQGQPGTNA